MDEKFELHSKFQLEGVFWDAARPDDKFAGTLSCDGKRLELVTRAELVTPTPAMLMGTDEASVPDVVHGFTVKGDCTIVGLQQIDTPGLLDYSRERGVRWRYFRVIGPCLMGWHLPSDTTDVLTAADLTYTAINEWLPGCGVATTFTEDAVTISFPKKRPTFLDVCVLSNRVRVVIKIDPNFQFRFGGKGHSSLSEPIIMLEPEQPKSLQWFVDAIHRFENFLSLCLGSSVRAKTVRLIGQSEENESDGSYDLAVEEPRNRMCRSGFAAIAFNSRPRLHHGSRLQRKTSRADLKKCSLGSPAQAKALTQCCLSSNEN